MKTEDLIYQLKFRVDEIIDELEELEKKRKLYDKKYNLPGIGFDKEIQYDAKLGDIRNETDILDKELDQIRGKLKIIAS